MCIVYFDREKDLAQRKMIVAERNRLIQKMMSDKKGGAPTRPAEPSMHVTQNCGDHEHVEKLNFIEAGE